MKRFALAVVTASALGVSIATGIIAADWPFWHRVFTLPTDTGEWPESYYSPTVAIDGGGSGFFPLAAPEARTISPAAINAAKTWAGGHNTAALLVLHRGKVQIEQYWQGMAADRLYSGRAMSRSLLPFLFGRAIESGQVESLDAPVSTWLTEWEDDPRGKITVRQLLWSVSGLEDPPAPPPPGASWFSRVKSALGKGGRLSLGTDFAATALDFDAAYPPGTRFAFSNAGPQLLGVILERATGQSYEQLVERELWTPLGASRAEFYLDRRGGMPAVYCCLRATPRDFLRLGAALIESQAPAALVLPQGWWEEMARSSIPGPWFGLQLWSGNPPAGVREYLPGSGQGVLHREPFAARTALWMEGGGGRTIWAFPDEELVVVRLGRAAPDWDATTLPNILLRGLQ